jgi:PBSX family phage terminase large subunit
VTTSAIGAVLQEAQRKLSAAQIISVARSHERTISLWVGAVSAGKTIASLFAFLIAIKRAPEVGQIVIVGKTLQTIERNVIKQLQTRKIFGLLADQVIHTTGSSKAIILGREVDLIGANNKAAEERIRGGSFGLVYVDEATIVPREFFDMLATRLRVKGARMLATTNPGSKNHWLRKEYILRAVEVDLIMFKLTMHDNPLYFEGGDVGPEYIARMERTYSGVFYKRFILGEWTTAEGAVYGEWNPDVGGGHVIPWLDIPPLRRIVGIGIDYGVTNPTVALMVGLTDERHHETRELAPRLILLDEWVDDPAVTGRNRSPSEHGALFRSWLPERHYPDHILVTDPRAPFVIVDPSAKGFREELARPASGLHGIVTHPADNSVMEGIADVSNLMAREHPNGGRLFQSTDRCDRWNSEVTEYVWDKDEAEEGKDVVVKLNDHAMDAGRYGVRTTKGLWLPLFRQAYGIAA